DLDRRFGFQGALERQLHLEWLLLDFDGRRFRREGRLLNGGWGRIVLFLVAFLGEALRDEQGADKSGQCGQFFPVHHDFLSLHEDKTRRTSVVFLYRLWT